MSQAPLVSVVLPFWKRGAALKRLAANFNEVYASRLGPIELVVVDDGSPADSAREIWDYGPGRPASGLNGQVIELPIKDHPLNPCVPINRGVEAAGGEFVLLTSPEVWHPAPIVFDMVDALRSTISPASELIPVVCAAVWCNERNIWLQHSQHANHHYHFCNLMRKSDFEAVGGFCEEYRDGYCFRS